LEPPFDGATRLADCLRDLIACHVLKLWQDSVTSLKQLPAEDRLVPQRESCRCAATQNPRRFVKPSDQELCDVTGAELDRIKPGWRDVWPID